MTVPELQHLLEPLLNGEAIKECLVGEDPGPGGQPIAIAVTDSAIYVWLEPPTNLGLRVPWSAVTLLSVVKLPCGSTCIDFEIFDDDVSGVTVLDPQSRKTRSLSRIDRDGWISASHPLPTGMLCRETNATVDVAQRQARNAGAALAH